MADIKICPKCKGGMAQGRILKYNEYTVRNQHLYVFAADDEPAPEPSKMFSGRPGSASRKALVAYCCEQCGFVEFYGQAMV